MKRLIYTIAALGLLVSSCSKNDESSVDTIADTQVRISTSAITKATDDVATSTYTGTDLGLSLDYGDGDRYTVTDSKWTYSATDGWSTLSTVLWKNDTDAVDILAFAPYEDGLFDILAENNVELGTRNVPFYIQADQSSGTVESDFVAFESLDFVPSSANLVDGSVPITFEHVLSQLNITLTYGEEFYEFFTVDGIPTVTSVEVKAYQIAVYDFDDQETTLITQTIDSYGNVTTEGTALDKITVTAYPTVANEEYTVIFPPQSYTADELMITANINDTEVDRSFEFTVPSSGYTFEQGKSYTMNIRVGKDRLYIDDAVTVVDWNDGEDDVTLNGGDAEEDL